jgi:hypothetical protein
MNSNKNVKLSRMVLLVFAIMLGASILPPALADIAPPGCSASTLSILGLHKDKTDVHNGDVVHYAVHIGTNNASGGCNNTGITVTFFKPDINGNPDLGSPVTLDSGRAFPADGSGDTCWYESATGQAICAAMGTPFQLFHANIDWTVNVNPGVTAATVRATTTCPSGSCLHDNLNINDTVSNSKDISVNIPTPTRTPPPPTSVPALNPIGLLALAGVLCIVAVSIIRRRGK